MVYQYMDYIPFSLKNPNCIHVFMSNRVYNKILLEVFRNGDNETGGVFIGHIFRRAWYIADMIDPGKDNTIHRVEFFQWNQDYVNESASQICKLYKHPATILGFWHRHPGSMDFFSQTDVESTQKNLQNAKKGLLSMLVNIDPKLRMTFYYCFENHFMPVRFDVGDEYFPLELMEYASPEDLCALYGHQHHESVQYFYQRILPPPGYDKLQKRSVKAVNDTTFRVHPEPVKPTPVPQPEVAEAEIAKEPEEMNRNTEVHEEPVLASEPEVAEAEIAKEPEEMERNTEVHEDPVPVPNPEVGKPEIPKASEKPDEPVQIQTVSCSEPICVVEDDAPASHREPEDSDQISLRKEDSNEQYGV